MARQFSGAFRNAAANSYESTVGVSPILRFYSAGAIPADCAAAPLGTLLALGSLPSDWLNPATGVSGQVTKLGTWTVTGQAAAGAGTTIGYFRLYDSTGTTCHDQGTVSVTGGGGDLTVDNVSVANAQVVTVSGWTLTMGGA